MQRCGQRVSSTLAWPVTDCPPAQHPSHVLLREHSQTLTLLGAFLKGSVPQEPRSEQRRLCCLHIADTQPLLALTFLKLMLCSRL